MERKRGGSKKGRELRWREGEREGEREEEIANKTSKTNKFTTKE